MRLAKKGDKKKVIQIISEAFDNNPSVNWVIKNDIFRKQRIRVLARYAFNVANRRSGVYLSSDEEGVVICYQYKKKKDDLFDYIDQLYLALFAVGLSRIGKVLRRESYIQKARSEDNDFLYFWFWGISKKGKGQTAARESKDFIFELSEKLKLRIYLETSVAKNKNVYERYGFKTYAIWQDSISLWLMRREI